jgi:hypothetical protein
LSEDCIFLIDRKARVAQAMLTSTKVTDRKLKIGSRGITCAELTSSTNAIIGRMAQEERPKISMAYL